MTQTTVIPMWDVPTVPVAGTAARFPVRRIFCIGMNYAEHVREIDGEKAKTPPAFFLKASDGVVTDGADVVYPPSTHDFHYEAELVVAIETGGRDIAPERALEHVFGYAVGNDLTRRDLQTEARKIGGPWDTSKSFEGSAPIGPIHPVGHIGHPERGHIWLDVNGERRQSADLSDMILPVPEIISRLSAFFTLKPGDLIFTGTPSGVGPVKPGDVMEVGIDGLGTLRTRVVQG